MKVREQSQRHHPDNPLYASEFFPAFFITKVLAAKSVAQNADLMWAQHDLYLRQAENLKSLAAFLRSPTSPGMPPPVPVSDENLRFLEEVEWRIRRLAAPRDGPMKVTRESKSRERIAFTSQISADLTDLFGEPLDAVVTALANLFYPEVTIDQVISARKPRTPV